jgi:hypothetical protein
MDPQNIPLQLMYPQLVAGPEDDWTGKTDPKERKRLQDRINQRITRETTHFTRYIKIILLLIIGAMSRLHLRDTKKSWTDAGS